MKILILNDAQNPPSSIQWMLEDEGFEVRFAKNGQDGYSPYLSFHPDFDLTDIRMTEETASN